MSLRESMRKNIQPVQPYNNGKRGMHAFAIVDQLKTAVPLYQRYEAY